MRKLRLVFISYLEGFGGAEKQNIMLANEMVTRGHEVTIISLNENNPCYPIDSRVSVIFVPDMKGNVLKIFNRYNNIKKILKVLRPDVTINFWFSGAYMTVLMPRRITGPIIYAERGDPGDSEYDGMLGFVRKLTIPLINGFVFQSKGAEEYFDQKIQKRSIIIPNPVYIPEGFKRSSKSDDGRVVSVGRLHHQKNQALLIDAFSIVHLKSPNTILEIYGDGEMKDELQTLIDANKLTDVIKLMGTSNNIYERIVDASVFVLSSDYEGMPNALLEATALGIPCVSTDCKPGGAREIIEDGINGFIVPIRDKKKLASAIIDLLLNKEMRMDFSKEGIAKGKQFRADAIYKKWEDFFYMNCMKVKK